ncbi:MAG: 16S rRNA (cytosine(967)-C(5))-methyltransferase RsmB [Desulfarculus sp.]|nr:16S rRNA (cytosine(967)-C(5))-methyltransferase RsmB [Desulfarculus sp.]
MDPRRAAFRVLGQTQDTPRRLEALLDEELSRHQAAAPRDRAFTANLVYTVLRQRAYLDHLLAAFVRRPLDKLDPPVLAVLRLGAAELVCLRTPDHAAVHAAVNLARSLSLHAATGLVNASLRALARGWRQAPPPAGDAASVLAIRYSHPAWLVAELLERHGQEETEAWLLANQQPRPPALRAGTLRVSREGLRELLEPHCQDLRQHPLADESLILAGPHPPVAALPGFAEGLWQMQDPGATAIGHLVGVQPGLRVLDLCAGAGGKTGHLAALMHNQGELIAVEPSPGRAKALTENLARLGVTNARVLEADGTNLPAGLGRFDRVLVDAPCTGLGVLGRRPDLRWRRGPGDPARLAGLQLALACAAADLLAPGGAMLYATCTVTGAENEDVVAALLAARPALRLEWQKMPDNLLACLDAEGFWRTQPQVDACDGFFAARLALVKA